MKPPRHWVSGDLPQRATPRGPRQPPTTTLTPKQAERLARLRDTGLVGRPLAAAVRSRAPGGGGRAPTITFSGIAPLAAAVALLVLGIARTDFVWLSGGAALALIAGLLLKRRQAALSFVESAGRLGPFDHEVAALDTYLASVAPKLPTEALRRLATIKETLATLLVAGGDEPRVLRLPPEEQFFARETVSRYLPDACRYYLEAIRASEGLFAAEGERTIAAQSLCCQLDILSAHLERNLKLIAADKHQELADHEAFIKTKG